MHKCDEHNHKLLKHFWAVNKHTSSVLGFLRVETQKEVFSTMPG